MLSMTAQQFDEEARAMVERYMKKVDDDKLANAEAVGVLDCIRFDILQGSLIRDSLPQQPR